MKFNKIAIKRFWSKVNVVEPDSCWEWRAGLFPRTNYGCFWFNGRNIGAHRFLMSLRVERVLSGDEYVCHSCDNPPCCNPDHLFLGTNKDNQQDLVKKGRQRKGEQINTSKLTGDQVIEIRRLYDEGWDFQSLNERFDIQTARSIVAGESWKHLESSKTYKRGLRLKLNRAKVLQLRSLHKAGATGRELADRFDISIDYALDVATGRFWTDVE